MAIYNDDQSVEGHSRIMPTDVIRSCTPAGGCDITQLSHTASGQQQQPPADARMIADHALSLSLYLSIYLSLSIANTVLFTHMQHRVSL